jgi:hypothetical protein
MNGIECCEICDMVMNAWHVDSGIIVFEEEKKNTIASDTKLARAIAEADQKELVNLAKRSVNSIDADAELARAIAEADQKELVNLAKRSVNTIDADAALAKALAEADLANPMLNAKYLTEEEIKREPGLIKCPNCGILILVAVKEEGNSLFCGIFRCLALTTLANGKLNKDQIAHASKVQIDEWIRIGWVDQSKCCCVPFEIHNLGDKPKVLRNALGELWYK